MRKIVYVLHGLSSGGTEAFVMNVVKEIKDDFDITFILALGEGTKQFREEEAQKLGVRILRTCDLNTLQKKILHFKKLKKLLKETGPYDVMHSNMDLFNGINLLAAKQSGIPIRVSHSHNSFSQYATTNIKKVVVYIYRKVMRYLIRRTATLKLGCSKLANDYLYGAAWEKDSNCNVLYNGIDMERFRAKVYRKSNGLYKFITVGRLINQKNPFFIIDIIYELKKSGVNNIKLSWVGNGELKEKVVRHTKEMGVENEVEFLGLRKDIPELLKEHEYFLMPSLFEGLPIALIEAQAAGVKCFVSDSVTKEVNVGLCTYISLEKTAGEWAKEIVKEIESGKDYVLDQNKLKEFDVKNTVNILKEYYNQ